MEWNGCGWRACQLRREIMLTQGRHRLDGEEVSCGERPDVRDTRLPALVQKIPVLGVTVQVTEQKVIACERQPRQHEPRNKEQKIPAPTDVDEGGVEVVEVTSPFVRNTGHGYVFAGCPVQKLIVQVATTATEKHRGRLVVSLHDIHTMQEKQYN